MNVRRIVAPTMEEALEKVRRHLGENAIILSSRKERIRGWRGLFGQYEVVITAVADEHPASRKDFLVQKEALLNAIRQVKHGEDAQDAARNVHPDLSDQKAHMVRLHEHLETSSSPSTLPLTEVMEKLTALEELQLAQSGLYPFRPGFRPWAKRLQASGMALKTIYRLYAASPELSMVDDEEAVTRERLKAILHDKIRSRFPASRAQEAWAAFIGPTGVGKTTTIAKLAAQAKLERHLPVALMTIDTYRIAAVEQLRTYADILHVPFAVTYTPHEFDETLGRWLDEGYYVLIDTAGRNYFQEAHVEGLKDYIHRLDALPKKGAKYLVSSLTAREDDTSRLIRLFQPLGFRQLILTKYDEVPEAGRVLELLLTHRIRLSYLTTGQDVPDDVRQADAEWLLDEALGEGSR
ncbi:MAG: flagellar biosynthesis protein FlhF [Candidatus Carbobacillus altaicus]|uniref:Flagellar biosynthesis protein FlhF n=1 Tax=Candidatus Carbonibacillus altaicus TaxID=2163959 RepID=A0A2R6Y4W9_9BACL|nr:flagellar biosynthesis protein FlhF [Candidatus Carbobacillus altaicus]PTQ57708.1 MAG: Flagellar biosynthesis protein FlhF [Candidatus Carbobacillus altaicus]